MNLRDLPQDVLLYVLGFCELGTGISFSMACSKFYALLQKRSFWITYLAATRLSKPIPCPLHEDLTAHDLASLKRIAFHCLRLEHNWDLPKPHVIGSIKTVKLGNQPRLDVVFQVPGTELYLLHSRPLGSRRRGSRRQGFVACWDIGLGRAVSPPTYVGQRILDVSPGQDQPGQFSMGLLVNDGHLNKPKLSLVIVCLQHGHSTVNVQITLHYDLSPRLSHWAVFMTKEIVGVLRCDVAKTEPTVELLAINILSGKATVVKTDIPYNPSTEDGHSATTACDGDVFILIERDNTSVSFCCPKEYLPHDANTSCPDESFLRCNAAAPRISHGSGTNYYAEGALSSDPLYGVPATSIHRVSSPTAEDLAIHIRFWARSSSNATFLTMLQCADVPGEIQDSPGSSWQLMLIPHSGRQVLLVVDCDENVVLRLVRYHPETLTVSVHELELPSFIDLSLVYGLSLDDHRGVISLLDERVKNDFHSNIRCHT